jgi:hypothetical protein
VGEVAAVLEAVFDGARRADGGVGEAVGEARAESLLGDVGEAVVGVAGESSRSGVGTPGGGVAHRSRLLEGDADAAASGVFDGLFGLVSEAVVLQAVTERSHTGGMRWAREHAPPTRPTGRRGRGPRGARWRAASRGCGRGVGGIGVCVCLRATAGSTAGQAQGMCSRKKRYQKCVRKGFEGMGSERDKGRGVFPF